MFEDNIIPSSLFFFPAPRQKYIVHLTLGLLVVFSAMMFLTSCTEDDRHKNKHAQKQQNKATTANTGNREMKDIDCQRGCVVLTGASYAKGWPLSEINGLPVVNTGVGGEQSFEVLSRFEKDVIAIKPRAVIIWGYINDIHRSERSNIETAINKAKDSFRAMVALSEKNGIIPILATEVTIRHRSGLVNSLQHWAGKLLGKKSYQDYVNQHVLALNRWLLDFAREKDLLVLDLQPIISDASNMRLKKYAADDGTHISELGYAQ